MKLSDCQNYRLLQKHHQNMADKSMSDWFIEDSERFSRLSIQVGDILLDYSKNRLTSARKKLSKRHQCFIFWGQGQLYRKSCCLAYCVA
jgi:hypothetical protein